MDKNKKKVDNRPSHDPAKSFAEMFFGKKSVDKAGGGGTMKKKSKSLSEIRKELKGY